MPSYLWSVIFLLSAIFSFVLFWSIRWTVNRRDPGLSGLSALFAMMSVFLSPLRQLWSDIVVTAIYAILIGGVLLRKLPDKELTLTPIYLSAILVLQGSDRLAIYFILFAFGVWTLWRIERLYKAFEFFIGFTALVIYCVYWNPRDVEMLHSLLIPILLLTFVYLITYGHAALNSHYSEFYNFMIQAIAAIVIYVLCLLWWREAILHHGYWWPLGFGIYLGTLWIICPCVERLYLRRPHRVKRKLRIARTASRDVTVNAHSCSPRLKGNYRWRRTLTDIWGLSVRA